MPDASCVIASNRIINEHGCRFAIHGEVKFCGLAPFFCNTGKSVFRWECMQGRSAGPSILALRFFRRGHSYLVTKLVGLVGV